MWGPIEEGFCSLGAVSLELAIETLRGQVVVVATKRQGIQSIAMVLVSVVSGFKASLLPGSIQQCPLWVATSLLFGEYLKNPFMLRIT